MVGRALSSCLVFLVCTLNATECARVLGVFHMPSYSHFVLGETLFKELARRGHEVTMISSFPQKTPIPNYRDLALKKLPAMMEERKDERNIFDVLNIPVFLIPLVMGDMGIKITEAVFEDDAVQDLLKSEEKFDLVIVEQFINDAHKGFAYHFDAPLVVFSTIGSSTWINHLVGNPNPLAYASNTFLSYSSHMTFFQRVKNTLFSTFADLYYHLYFFKKQDEILKKHIPNSPDLVDIMYNTSLILLNSHVTCNPPLPHVPNMIEVGGLHMKEAGELPVDLQKFLDDSTEGVIYFAFGSNIRSKDMPKEKKEEILNAIGKLRLKVLWKFEEDDFPNMPRNLKIAKWFPQQSILAHPNVKLFITHGGLLSTMESVYYGVPVLGIPIFGDQKMNMAEAVEKGYGLAIPYSELDENTFYSTINEIIDNPRYSKNAKAGSRILRDRETKPLDSAVYWIEYVLRHRGAYHFRSAALDLRWYQLLLLDVIAFLIAVVSATCSACYYLLKYLLKRRKQNKVKLQ